MLIQGVEQAIGEAPEEEEDCDEADWVEGLLESQLCCLCPLLVRGPQGAALPEFFGEHLDSSRALTPHRSDRAPALCQQCILYAVAIVSTTRDPVEC